MVRSQLNVMIGLPGQTSSTLKCCQLPSIVIKSLSHIILISILCQSTFVNASPLYADANMMLSNAFVDRLPNNRESENQHKLARQETRPDLSDEGSGYGISNPQIQPSRMPAHDDYDEDDEDDDDYDDDKQSNDVGSGQNLEVDRTSEPNRTSANILNHLQSPDNPSRPLNQSNHDHDTYNPYRKPTVAQDPLPTAKKTSDIMTTDFKPTEPTNLIMETKQFTKFSTPIMVQSHEDQNRNYTSLAPSTFTSGINESEFRKDAKNNSLDKLVVSHNSNQSNEYIDSTVPNSITVTKHDNVTQTSILPDDFGYNRAKSNINDDLVKVNNVKMTTDIYANYSSRPAIESTIMPDIITNISKQKPVVQLKDPHMIESKKSSPDHSVNLRPHQSHSHENKSSDVETDDDDDGDDEDSDEESSKIFEDSDQANEQVGLKKPSSPSIQDTIPKVIGLGVNVSQSSESVKINNQSDDFVNLIRPSTTTSSPSYDQNDIWSQKNPKLKSDRHPFDMEYNSPVIPMTNQPSLPARHPFDDFDGPVDDPDDNFSDQDEDEDEEDEDEDEDEDDDEDRVLESELDQDNTYTNPKIPIESTTKVVHLDSDPSTIYNSSNNKKPTKKPPIIETIPAYVSTKPPKLTTSKTDISSIPQNIEISQTVVESPKSTEPPMTFVELTSPTTIPTTMVYYTTSLPTPDVREPVYFPTTSPIRPVTSIKLSTTTQPHQVSEPATSTQIVSTTLSPLPSSNIHMTDRPSIVTTTTENYTSKSKSNSPSFNIQSSSTKPPINLYDDYFRGIDKSNPIIKASNPSIPVEPELTTLIYQRATELIEATKRAGLVSWDFLVGARNEFNSMSFEPLISQPLFLMFALAGSIITIVLFMMLFVYIVTCQIEPREDEDDDSIY